MIFGGLNYGTTEYGTLQSVLCCMKQYTGILKRVDTMFYKVSYNF